RSALVPITSPSQEPSAGGCTGAAIACRRGSGRNGAPRSWASGRLAAAPPHAGRDREQRRSGKARQRCHVEGAGFHEQRGAAHAIGHPPTQVPREPGPGVIRGGAPRGHRNRDVVHPDPAKQVRLDASSQTGRGWWRETVKTIRRALEVERTGATGG